jgi:general secretion pathway protein A
LDMRMGNQPRPNSNWKKTAMAFVSIIFMFCLLYGVFMGIPLEWRDKIQVDKHEITASNDPIITSPPLNPVKKVEPPLVEAKPLQPELLQPEPQQLEPQQLEPQQLKPLQPEPALANAPLIEKGEASRILSVIKETATRERAFLHIASLWNNESTIHLNPLTQQIQSNVHFFKIAAAQNNFQMLYLEKSQDLMERLNLPVKSFFGVDGITPDNEYIIFPGMGETKYKIDPKELSPYLSGDMYIAWKDNFGYDRVITRTSSKDSIMSLKLLLTEIGFPIVDMTPVYDGPVRQAIKQIQKKYGLVEDGLVGPLTKIVLFNEKKETAVPALSKNRFKLDQ